MSARADLRRIVGDDWEWSWTTTANVSGWSSPVITIRRSQSATAEVLATSTGGSPTITTTGTNFASGTFAWQVARAVTAAIEPGPAWLEVEVLVAGKARTIMSEPLTIVDQVAVR